MRILSALLVWHLFLVLVLLLSLLSFLVLFCLNCCFCLVSTSVWYYVDPDLNLVAVVNISALA